MFGIGPMELVVIVVVALLIFGPQRLPEFARTLGKGLAEFRRASNDLRQTLALDELQDDLRKTANQLTNPTAGRPAQAGDSLPPGAGAGAERKAPGDGAPPWKDNPGELPEGRDHEHHDPPVGADADATADTTAGHAATGAVPRPSPADPGLGNVPVNGADPSDARRG